MYDAWTSWGGLREGAASSGKYLEVTRLLPWETEEAATARLIFSKVIQRDRRAL